MHVEHVLRSFVWERRIMQYEEFRNAVLGLLEEDKEWSVHAEWQEVPAVLSCGNGNIPESCGKVIGGWAEGGGAGKDTGNGAGRGIGNGTGSVTGSSSGSSSSGYDLPVEDFIELEQEKGPFYEFMTISINRLFFSYIEDGWDAVCRDLEKYTRRENRGVRRARGIDYEARLNGEGAALYKKLRELRSRIAAQKQLPPYFVFMNRSLYEMCCRQPSTMEELRGIYGVGEKNSKEYGEEFLMEISKYTGGVKMQMTRLP